MARSFSSTEAFQAVSVDSDSDFDGLLSLEDDAEDDVAVRGAGSLQADNSFVADDSFRAVADDQSVRDDTGAEKPVTGDVGEADDAGQETAAQAVDDGESESDHENLPQFVQAHACLHEPDNSPAAYDNQWTRRNDMPDLPNFSGQPDPTESPTAGASPSYFLKLFLWLSFGIYSSQKPTDIWASILPSTETHCGSLLVLGSGCQSLVQR